jgi:hypothetical protein
MWVLKINEQVWNVSKQYLHNRTATSKFCNNLAVWNYFETTYVLNKVAHPTTQ